MAKTKTTLQKVNQYEKNRKLCPRRRDKIKCQKKKIINELEIGNLPENTTRVSELKQYLTQSMHLMKKLLKELKSLLNLPEYIYNGRFMGIMSM